MEHRDRHPRRSSNVVLTLHAHTGSAGNVGRQAPASRPHRLFDIWLCGRLPGPFAGRLSQLELSTGHDHHLNRRQEHEQEEGKDQSELDGGTPPITHLPFREPDR